jgi:RNA polymerase sigma-70 factor (ECF subfamily)
MIDLKTYSDAELFLLLQQGEKAAFEVIYERYFIRLVNTAFKRLHSRDEAMEVVQELFLQLYQKRTQIEYTQNLPAYLHTSLRNKIIDRFRVRMSREKHHNYLRQIQSSEVQEQPELVMDCKLLAGRIRGVIDQLPEKCREAFLLSRVEQLSHQGITERLNISLSTVEKHIGKALKIIRRQVKDFI